MSCKLIWVLLNKLHNVFGGVKFEKVFIVVDWTTSNDIKIALVALFPHLPDFFQIIFDRKLLSGIFSQFLYLVHVCGKLKTHNFFVIEAHIFLTELFFELMTKLIPMTVSHRILL